MSGVLHYSPLHDRQMMRMLALSAGLHIVLFLVLFLAPGLGRPVQIGMRPPIPIDLVPGVPMSPMPKGQPDSLATVAEKGPREEGKAPEPKKEPEPIKRDVMPLPVTNPTKMQKEPEKDDGRRHDMDSAVERIRKKKLQENQQFGDPEGIEGTQPYPGTGGIRDRIVNLYLAKIQEKVERNWVRPAGVPATTSVQVRIFFRLDSAGGVLEPRLVQSSGFLMADRTAMAALQKAVPFDPPPPTVAAALQRDGIELVFELNR